MSAAPPASEPLPQLLCLQAAGTTSAMFADLDRHLKGEAKVETIDLPGRRSKFKQPFLCNMDAAIAHILPQVAEYPDGGYAIFGYSMGALIGFELSRRLIATGGPRPAVLIVAAARAPQLLAREDPMHLMDDATLVRELVRFQGTLPELLADAELMKLILPRLRADLTLCETYEVDTRHRVPIAIHAIGGSSDEMITSDDLAAWLDLTDVGGTHGLMPGGHFFIEDQVKPLAIRISAILRDTFGPLYPPGRIAGHG